MLGTAANNHLAVILDSSLALHWNPSIADTIGEQHFVPLAYSEVSLPQGYISGRRGVRNRATVAMFSELFLAVRWRGRLSTTSNSANLMSSC